MNDNINQLEKLAALKERGVITQEEFADQKRALLDLSPGKPKMSTSRKVAYVFAVGFVIVLASSRYFHILPVETPGCDSPSVKEKALLLGNEQIPAPFANLGMRIAGLLNVKELHHDNETGFRACVAETRMSHDGAGSLGFTVEWQDKENGAYLVKVADTAALIGQYAPPPAATPQAATKQPDAAPIVAALEAAPVPTLAPEQLASPSKTTSNDTSNDIDKPESCVDGWMKEYDAHPPGDGPAKVTRKDAEAAAQQKCEAGT